MLLQLQLQMQLQLQLQQLLHDNFCISFCLIFLRSYQERDNADMAISSNSQNITEIPDSTEIVEDTNSMEISESNKEDGLSAILCAYLHPIAMIVTIGVSEWTTDSR